MSETPGTLSTIDHDRNGAGLTYVYPVVSRRAGGVSVGINLNPNNACNWRCIYCQVPDLKRGGPPPIDLPLLQQELTALLADIVHGDFLTRCAPPDMRRLKDVALSGNGEPTSATEFFEAVQVIGQAMEDFGLLAQGVKLVLITNGSLSHRAYVKRGIERMRAYNGDVWFKFDRATKEGMLAVNGTGADPERHYRRLSQVAHLCPTWLQTCMFALDQAPPSDGEIEAYLAMLARCRREHVPLQGVLLYGIARPSMQKEASRISPVSDEWLHALAARIEKTGHQVRVTP